MRVMTAALIPLLAVAASALAQQPIIDMHLHASAAAENGPPPLALCVPVREYPVRDPDRRWEEIFIAWQKNPPCPDPVWSPPTDQALMEQTIAVLKRRSIIGVLSGPAERVQQWRQAAPDRFIPGFQFRFGRERLSADSLRRLYKDGHFVVLAEVTNQYLGIAPGDSLFEPYLAVAEELDIAVGVHIGIGPPGAPYLGFNRYRAALHSALTLEEVLVRHPNLRVYIMHAGWPMLDDLLAVLWAHPQVYLDVGGIVFGLPRAEFLPVPPAHRRGGLRQAGNVRIGSDGVARGDRAGTSGDRVSSVLERHSKARRPVQQRGSVSSFERCRDGEASYTLTGTLPAPA